MFSKTCRTWSRVQKNESIILRYVCSSTPSTNVHISWRRCKSGAHGRLQSDVCGCRSTCYFVKMNAFSINSRFRRKIMNRRHPKMRSTHSNYTRFCDSVRQLLSKTLQRKRHVHVNTKRAKLLKIKIVIYSFVRFKQTTCISLLIADK